MNTLEIAAKLLANSDRERRLDYFKHFQVMCGVPNTSRIDNEKDFFYIKLYDDFSVLNQIYFYYLKDEFIGYRDGKYYFPFYWASEESYFKMKSYLESISVSEIEFIQNDLDLLYEREEVDGSKYNDNIIYHNNAKVKIIKVIEEGWLEEKWDYFGNLETNWHSEKVQIQYENGNTDVVNTESLTFKQIL